MLERFHYTEKNSVRIPADDMRAAVEDIFRKMGMPDEGAVQSADLLIYADLRGIETHGTSDRVRSYVEGFSRGGPNPTPNWKIVREAAAVATVDGDGGLGIQIGPQMMELAIEKAKVAGIGAVAVTNCGHFGAAAYHAQMALEHDQIGIAMTIGGTGVLPTGGAEKLIGLNPLGIAAPTNAEPPFVFDAAMSSVAGGKIRLAKLLGVEAGPGWLAEPDGTPIMESTMVPDEYAILPLGGDRESGSHKGYSLGIMIEILSGVLSGNGAGFMRRNSSSHHFIAYDIEKFTDVTGFKADMDALLKRLKESKPAPGNDRVMYAGLGEHEEELDRRANGVPYHESTLEYINSICGELGLQYHFG